MQTPKRLSKAGGEERVHGHYLRLVLQEGTVTTGERPTLPAVGH